MLLRGWEWGKFFLRLLLLVPDVALALHTLPLVAASLWTSRLSAVFFWDAAYMPPWHSPLDDDTLGTCGRMVSSSQHLTALKHPARAADLEWMSANQESLLDACSGAEGMLPPQDLSWFLVTIFSHLFSFTQFNP